MHPHSASQVASIGLAVRACAPSLLHAIRGSLHDVAMLAALLQPPDAPDLDDGSAAAKAAKRLRAMQTQLKALERDIAMLGAITAWPDGQSDAVCATASALPDVLRLLKDEAARRLIRLDDDTAELPPHVLADERALQQALLACGAWTAQQLDEHATLRLSGREEDGEAVFEFVATPSTAVRGMRDDDQALLAALVAAAGGKLSTGARLRLAFRRASDRIASSP